MPKVSSREEQPTSGAVTTEAGYAGAAAEPIVSEPKLDPEMEKYMAIVRQQREKEKQVELRLLAIGCWVN